jgi:hypothetical protein
MKKKIIKDFC